jgi:endonuclease/exonuclease/phosphatase family metal-dependent hydrolase
MTSSRQRYLLLVASFWCFTFVLAGCGPTKTPPPASSDGYLFCFWNVENFFDDKLDGWTHDPDRGYDAWFATDPKALNRKLDNLTTALLKMNDGRGPDILALAECESERAVELLRDRLNTGIKDEEMHYKNILFKDPKGGRSIATAILTRLDVNRSKTQLHGKRLRILEGHIRVNDHDLVVFATHWTSRVSDKEGTSRDHYADAVYGSVKAMYKSNPKVDALVCGDFNDPPDAESVTKHLHAISDPEKVKSSDADGPFLLDLMARDELVDKRPAKGTHFYHGAWCTFDQICVSPGLLDKEGWSCDPATMRIVNDLTADRRGRPHRFGEKNDPIRLEDRGYSDHFPVAVRLTVAGK